MAGIDYEGFEAGDDTVIWRYMTKPRFERLLEGRLYFAAAHQFDDAFEGAITESERKRREAETDRVFPEDAATSRLHLATVSEAFADLRRMTKINCWHARDHENISMWDRYIGPGNPGVAIRSTVGALKKSLYAFRLQPHYGEEAIQVGAVRYIDFATETMADRSMLGIFLHKRIEFRDEKEVRALLSLRTAAEWGIEIPEKGVEVDIDPAVLIHEIRVHPRAREQEIHGLAEIVTTAGCKCLVAASVLSAEPNY
jgi:hypothetical protein